MLSNYWGAVVDTYPDCFVKHKDYLLMSTLGLSSMMRIFPVVYGYAAREGDISRKNMRKYVGYLLENTPGHSDPYFRRPINESWWHRVDGPGGIVKGTGEGHYKNVAENLAKKIAFIVKEERGN